MVAQGLRENRVFVPSGGSRFADRAVIGLLIALAGVPPLRFAVADEAAPAKAAAEAEVEVEMVIPAEELAGIQVQMINGLAVNGAINVADDDEMKKRVAASLRGVLLSELHFVDKCCRLSPAQRERLVALKPKIQDEIGAKFLPMQRMILNGNFDPSVTPGPPKQVILNVLRPHLESLLEPPQQAEYARELKAADVARRRSMTSMLASRLEDALQLTAAQRFQLMDRLNAKWNVEWEASARLWMWNEGYCPEIPDDVFGDLIDDEQKSIWGTVGKYSSRSVFFGDLGVNDGEGMQALEWFGEKEAAPVFNGNVEDVGVIETDDAEDADFTVPEGPTY